MGVNVGCIIKKIGFQRFIKSVYGAEEFLTSDDSQYIDWCKIIDNSKIRLTDNRTKKQPLVIILRDHESGDMDTLEIETRGVSYKINLFRSWEKEKYYIVSVDGVKREVTEQRYRGILLTGGDYYVKLDDTENILYEDADIPNSCFKKKGHNT